MGTDLDPLDEVFSGRAANNARAGIKFQPKAKPRPRKEPSAVLLKPSVQTVDIAGNGLGPLVGPSLASSETLETKNSLQTNEDLVSGIHSSDDSAAVKPSLQNSVVGETLGHSGGLHSDILPDVDGDWRSSSGKLAREAIPMGTNLDPLDEIFSGRAANNARAGIKFQPKAKPRPRKEPSAVPLKPSVQAVDIAENGLGPLADPSLASSGTLGTKKSVTTNEDLVSVIHLSDNSAVVKPSLQYAVVGEPLGHSVGLHSDVVLPDVNGDLHSTTGKLAGESADMFVGLESLDDLYSQATTATVGAPSRSPRKVDLNMQLGNEFSMSCPVKNDAEGFHAHSEAPTVHLSGTRSAAQEPLNSVVSPFDDSAVRIPNATSSYPCPEVTIDQDPLTCGNAVVSNSDGGFHIDNRSLEIEEADTIPCFETLDNPYELTTRSGKRRGKFQPKPKAQAGKEKHGGRTSRLDGDESVPCSWDAQSVPSASEYINEGSIPAFPLNNPLDFSSLRFDDPTSQILENEPVNPVETPRSDSFVPEEQPEGVPEILEKVSPRAKCRKGKRPKVPDGSLEHQQAFVSGQENETRRSTRQLRKQINVGELVDESEDEADDDDDFTFESPSGSHVDEDDAADGENQVFNKTSKRKASMKSNKPAPKEKSVRKRKKSNEEPDKATQKPTKKFSHSTRRKRRQVDKVLLETPEDEIDITKLRIRDIILLAEHRERISIKEGKTSQVPSTNQSAGSSFVDYDEDGTFASEQGGFSDDQRNPTVQESSTYTNYQTYMIKTPRSRWSKRDTELFYEAVRQFGSDISMIQQLFPGRSRNQVKLKYKKEERQQPLRLHEALTTRATDHSHFQQVIERLKEIAAQEKENSCQDDSTALTGDEELNPAVNEEVAKPEQAGDGEVEAMEPDANEVQSPVKSCDSEDDSSIWSQYKSEL